MTWAVITVGLSLTLIGCTGPNTGAHGSTDSVDPVVSMLRTGIEQLSVNIESLTRQITDIRGLPASPDPILQELVALDLAVWQLHRQQWVLQLEHLRFTREHLLRKQAASVDRRQLLAEWMQRKQRYETTLEELRQQRQMLEQKRVRLEARLIAQSLQ